MRRQPIDNEHNSAQSPPRKVTKAYFQLANIVIICKNSNNLAPQTHSFFCPTLNKQVQNYEIRL